MTLVEVMIALVIILVLMLGLIQTAILAIDSNLRNVFRDEGVRIAEQTMNDLRNYPFDDAALNAGGPNCCGAANFPCPTRDFRNILAKTYAVCITITNITTDTKSLQVAVGWNHKQENPLRAPTNTEFQQYVTSLVRRPQLP
jgi:Tfp pilus assembly protein PilV